MLVIQHIWTKWTKRSRGANSPIKRRRLGEAYALPNLATAIRGEAVLRHEIRTLEAEDFELVEEFGPTDRDSWLRLQPHRNNALGWRLRGDEVEISLAKPSEYSQQTKWPEHLPKPLFMLREGETARIEWNGRFGFGSNPSSYYEQHVYWLAVTTAPHERLFLDAEPRKQIDLRRHIY